MSRRPRSIKFTLFFVFIVFILFPISAFLFWASTQHVHPIIMYHHVSPENIDASDTVSPEVFEMQLQFLKDNRFEVFSLAEFIEKKRQQRRIPQNVVVLTFDDGYDDNATEAMPILRQFQFDATFFLPYDKLNTEGRMTDQQVNELIKAGFTIGSHTKSEAYLPDFSLEDIRFELRESKKLLSEKFDIPIDFIAYPIGGFTEDIKKIVAEEGYLAAMTTNRGNDKSNEDIYELNRIKLKNSDNNFWKLYLKTSGYYNILRKLKNSH